MMGSLAIDGLHQQQFQIIGRAQMLWRPTLRYRLFPQHATALPSQFIPILLVIIDHRLIKAAFEFFQRHASRLRRSLGIVDPVGRVGQTAFKALGHPPKERLDGSLC